MHGEVVLAVMREEASTTPFLVRPEPEYLKTYIRYIAHNQAEHIIFYIYVRLKCGFKGACVMNFVTSTEFDLTLQC